MKPFGVTLTSEGAHIAVRSRHATAVYVCLFDEQNNERRLPLFRTGDERFDVFIPGVKSGQHYGLRADGPWHETVGHRFDVSKLLLDPYATEITRHVDWHESLAEKGIDTAEIMPRCIMHEPLSALQKNTGSKPNFILETPVKAYTIQHPDVPQHLRGTIAALATEPLITHFKAIGCDTIELMPICAWTDERHLARIGLRNAWGYNSVSFFAPDPSLAPGGMKEVRETVEVLHRHGIKVILDVVFNHTGESDFGGGTISLRGLDNALYFRMHDGALINDTGTGNTLALDRPACSDLVLASLRHWVQQAGVDGFRYDLAPVMGRLPTGFSPTAPLLQAITNDPVLSNCIHIAEPWDVGPGGYQLGNFPDPWHEWNDHFRDDVRKFWRGNAYSAGKFATRLAGSSDVFATAKRKPSASINFVAAHDGFALADVVRFDRKHNIKNGENNRDGSDSEVCWIDASPKQKIIAMLVSLFFARGTIMLTAGDEFGRSQNGNNNAYAQDNETTWRNWANRDVEMQETVANLAAIRRQYSDYFEDVFLSGATSPITGLRDIVWFGRDGKELAQTDWQNPAHDMVGLLIASSQHRYRLAVVFDRTAKAKTAVMPPAQKGMGWTVLNTPDTPYVSVRIEADDSKSP
jgi:glycogen debranching enzyme